MNIVVYDSWGGNTKKVAESIAKGLNCKCVKVDNVDVIDYDLIVIGSPVHACRSTKKIKEFLVKVKGKRCAVFCTYGVPFLGLFMANSCLHSMYKDLDCVGQFRCLGFHRILHISKGHPNKKELDKAYRFGFNLK